MSSPSTKARNSPRARSTPRLRAPPGPPCSGCSSVNRGSAAALARAIWALRSVEASSTMITSRSPNDWAAMESRQSARSPELLKNATTTLIRAVVTGSLCACPGGRPPGTPRSRGDSPSPRTPLAPLGGFPAKSHRVVNAFYVDLVPQREYDQQPHLPPGHLGIFGPEAAQDVKRGALVQPLTSLRRADHLLCETIHAAAEPVPERHREAELGAFRGGLGQQLADGLPQRELGGARGGLLHPGQARGHREHLAVKERR